MSSMSLAEYRELFPIQKNKKRRSAKQGTRQPSEGETVLATHLNACKISFEQEYKFHPTRRWRADFLLQVQRFWLRLKAVSGAEAVIQEVKAI